jgi:hypothetical protein
MRTHVFRNLANIAWQTRCRRYAIVIGLLLSTTAHADDWLDTYYQYRVPFTTQSQDAGWQRLPVSELQITKSINEIEQFQFDPAFFAYNYVKLVEVDDRGKVIEHPEAGFFLVPESEELASGALEGEEEKYTISVTRNQPHLLMYTASGGGKCPAIYYETIFQPGSSMRKSDYKISSFPPLLPLAKTKQEVFFVPDRDEMKLLVDGPFISTLHDLHVRRVRVELLAKLDSPGTKRWLLYYQPMCSHHLQIPQDRMDEMPAAAAQVVEIGTAKKYVGDTQYRLAETDLVGVSFADSTVKVTRQMPIPDQQRDEVTVRSAANEAQSFQLLLTPRKSGAILTGVKVSELKQEGSQISAENVDIHLVEYVPIRKSSYVTPARFLGDIGDPLVPVTRRRLEPLDGNVALWFTVRTPRQTAAGTYRGVVTLSFEDEKTIQVPVALEVYDFELPEFASFHTNLGGQYIATNMPRGDDARNMLDYHGLSSNDDLKALGRAYYDVMADNKICPKTVALFAEIEMSWSPPPKGYNVDAPGNFFELQDWNFSEFNDTLSHFIDEKKVNSVCLNHTNPTCANLFKHLPGKRLDGPARSSPHTTMAWQTFRKMTHIVYGKTPQDEGQDISIEVTQKQWDDLVLKYYRRIAQNLEKHGWLDRTHILIDETENPKRLNHFLGLLKSDPMTSRIRTIACIQGLSLVTAHHSGHAEKNFDFRRLIDTWVPQFDENYDRWMPYYWSDYDMTPDRDRLWSYLVTSSRLTIDTPGINNRLIALDTFRRGGSGLLIWETFAWDNVYDGSGNPWQDPYTRLGNGSLTYFYPPTRDGESSKRPDFTITPSLRLETLREGIDDFEYAQILENLVEIGRSKNIDVVEGETVQKDLRRFFPSNTHWSQNNAWYLTLRDRMAQTIVRLQERLVSEQK